MMMMMMMIVGVFIFLFPLGSRRVGNMLAMDCTKVFVSDDRQVSWLVG